MLGRLVFACSLLIASVGANAVVITGDIGFGGGFTPRDGLDNEVSLGSATKIDIDGDQALVTVAGSGSLSALTLGTVVTYNDFVLGSVPVSPLWTGGGFSFELVSMNVVEQTDAVIGMLGSGIMSGVGFTDTLYSWSFSGDSTGGVFAFSSTNSPVPEPGTLALLGAGLFGLGLMRRTRA